MKRIITTAGLAALGAASLHAAYAPGLTEMERSKPWSVSATLRGFYDDNYALRPSGETVSGTTLKQDSFGFQVVPRAAVNLPFGGNSFFGLDYTMDMRWYDAREKNDADYSHIANLIFDHAFSDSVKLSVSDNFAYFQEPELVESVVTTPVLLRSDMNNLRNLGRIGLRYEASRQVGFDLSYANTLYDYGQDGSGSYSALLDRMDHLVRLETRWTMQPTTVGLLGYQFGMSDHSSKDSLVWYAPYMPDTFTDPAIRDTLTHYFYVGAEHTFANALTGALRGGGTYTEYVNALPGATDNTLTPYVDASLTYAYSSGSHAQLGVKYDRNQTDYYNFDVVNSSYTLDQETFSVYGVLNHKITAKLSANLTGQLQYGQFRGGRSDGEVDVLYLLGINLAYQFNPHFSSEIGYNYDRLDSDIVARGYDRNRVYIGVKAAY